MRTSAWRILAALLVLFLFACGREAAAQSVAAEVDVTIGATTEDLQAAATQFRLFGELPRGWRFYADATLGDRRGPESDAFGAAYPYEAKLRPMELFVEKTVIRDQRLLGVRLGRYRTPFGLYGRSDHSYTGFLRAPLVRYSEYWALSNNYLETGGSLIAGATWLSAEVSLGVATDEDKYSRRGGMNTVARVQSAFGSLIVGVSHIRTRPSADIEFPTTGTTEFTGVDVRWMHAGVQVRGEWMAGRPFDRARTRGGYVDLLIHRPSMGPVTAVARIERLNFLAGRFSEFPRRYSLGAKLRVSGQLVGQVNFIHQPTDVMGHSGHTSLDIGLTLTMRRSR